MDDEELLDVVYGVGDGALYGVGVGGAELLDVVVASLLYADGVLLGAAATSPLEATSAKNVVVKRILSCSQSECV